MNQPVKESDGKRINKFGPGKKVGDGTPGPGRRKGVPNRSTVEFRETITQLLEENAENIGRWLTLVAEGDGTDSGKPDPGKALHLLSGLAEFAAPKLSRTEVKAEGEIGLTVKVIKLSDA
jgi:hypothetical protein